MPGRRQTKNSSSRPLGGGGRGLAPGSMLWKATTLVVFYCCVLTAVIVPGCAGQQDAQQQQQQQQEMGKQFLQELKEKPRDAMVRFKVGWWKTLDNGMHANDGIDLLMSCFDTNKVDKRLGEVAPLQGFLAAQLLGRLLYEQKEGTKARKFFNIAHKISKDQMSPSKEVGEVCTTLQLATMLEAYPTSNDAVDQSLARMEEWANKLISLYEQRHPDAYVNEKWMGQNVPGFESDPYVHCQLTLFSLSFYYRADVAKIANLHFQMAALVFPKLLYIAKHVLVYDKEQRQAAAALAQNNNNIEATSTSTTSTTTTSSAPGFAPTQVVQKCVDRKIKLGVIGSVFSTGHSVAEDFGGVLQRLDRTVFDVTFVLVHEGPKSGNPGDEDAFVTANPGDELIHYFKGDEDLYNGAWVRRLGLEIEKLEFDTIFYPDMTMATFVRRLGMERLAPVQINSHGHPVTSGHPRGIIQHFVSWAEAELPLEQSQTHYTEELQLIPKGKIHQYYTPRVEQQQGPGGKQRVVRSTKMPFDHYERKDFPDLPDVIRNSSPGDDDIHLYVCMQKPFKIFPEFDELLCGVLAKDPQGHAILHKEDMKGQSGIFTQRMIAAGCDMDRVHFVPSQLPHKLMALYDTASVILDSYPAGGCTTTREALELGKAVVTWPARLLGGRWTLGLYNAIGLDGPTKDLLIANSKEEYIAKAVELGTNKPLRKSVEANILGVIHNLFGRMDAVEEWEKILVRVSPVKQCAPERTGGGGGGDAASVSSAGSDEL